MGRLFLIAIFIYLSIMFISLILTAISSFFIPKKESIDHEFKELSNYEKQLYIKHLFINKKGKYLRCFYDSIGALNELANDFIFKKN